MKFPRKSNDKKVGADKKSGRNDRQMQRTVESQPHKHSPAAMLSEAELDALFDQQAQRAWAHVDALVTSAKAKLSGEKKSSLDPKAMEKVREFLASNKDHLM
jgi:hypothetical protein